MLEEDLIIRVKADHPVSKEFNTGKIVFLGLLFYRPETTKLLVHPQTQSMTSDEVVALINPFLREPLSEEGD